MCFKVSVSNMKKIGVAAGLIISLLLSGCMPFSSELLPVDQGYELDNLPQDTALAAVGDEAGAWQTEAVLYYPAQNQQELIEVRETVEVEKGQTLEACLVERLLEDDVPFGARLAAPQGTRLLSIRRGEGVAVVNLSVEEAGVESEQQLFLLRAAIARTLGAACDLDAVDVLFNGRARSAGTLAQGALPGGSVSALPLWMQLLSEEESVSAGESPSLERTAVLYGLTADGQRLVPYARTLSFEGDGLNALLDVLREETDCAYLTAALSGSEADLIKSAEVAVLSDGRRVVRLAIEGGALRAENEWMLYGALTCTLTGFLPGLDGVQIYIGSGQLTRLDTPQGEAVFEDGVLTRSMFETVMGRTVTVYMTADSGQLRAVTRVMADEDALSPRMIILELFGEPKVWETGVQRVVPDGLTGDDLLGVRIENGEAVLNFSARFYAGCQRLSAQQERNLVYALVNTLTERPDVTAVRLQIEGQSVDTLVSSISLRGPLLRNPGLILSDHAG